MARRLLLIDLGDRSVRALRRDLLGEGYAVDYAFGIEHAQNFAAMGLYNAIIIATTSATRLIDSVKSLSVPAETNVMPIIGICDLTADDEICAIAAGLSHNIDTTAAFAETLARLRSLLHIAEGFPQHFRIRDLGIDPIRRKASRAGVSLCLRPTDFDTLLFLAERADHLVTHAELHHRLWPSQAFSKNRIAVQMHKVRRAIRDGRQAPLLHTVRDSGYLLSQHRPEQLFGRA